MPYWATLRSFSAAFCIHSAALAVGINQGDVVLRLGFAKFCGLLEKAEGAGVVLFYAVTFSELCAKGDHGMNLVFGNRLFVIYGGFALVLGNTQATGVNAAKQGEGVGLAIFGGLLGELDGGDVFAIVEGVIGLLPQG